MKRPLITACVLSVVTSFGSATGAEPQPHLCIGYNPEKQNWDEVGPIPAMRQEDHCPDGSAFLGVSLVLGNPPYPRNVPVRGSCCPLPDGVLTNEHSWAEERCPKDSVATGSKAEPQVKIENGNWKKAMAEWHHVTQLMRCTKIDTSRFQLGEPVESLVIGFAREFDRAITQQKFTSLSRIPVALRYGVGRRGKFSLDAGGGRLGYPWGALLTGKSCKSCDLEFRLLQYRGIPGDPPAGTPVKVFPDCLSIDDPTSPDARCIAR